jgi:hypothetical protein
MSLLLHSLSHPQQLLLLPLLVKLASLSSECIMPWTMLACSDVASPCNQQDTLAICSTDNISDSSSPVRGTQGSWAVAPAAAASTELPLNVSIDILLTGQGVLDNGTHKDVPGAELHSLKHKR